jgi:hypothetical protein
MASEAPWLLSQPQRLDFRGLSGPGSSRHVWPLGDASRPPESVFRGTWGTGFISRRLFRRISDLVNALFLGETVRLGHFAQGFLRHSV